MQNFETKILKKAKSKAFWLINKVDNVMPDILLMLDQCFL